MNVIDRRRAIVALASAAWPLGSHGLPKRLTPSPGPGLPYKLWVGPGRQFRTLREAMRSAREGDTIEIEAGDYRGDVAIIDKDFVHIVGIGGRPRLIAAGQDVEGKAILIVRAQGVVIENLEFEGTRVADHYGSAIRHEKGSLLVQGCRFVDNELGLMTTNDPSVVLEINGCEFSGLADNSGRGSALSHSLYAGSIDSLRVEGSYFHDGSVGHLLKSRARVNVIRYNRLTDQGGISSYELEFPSGGLAEVVGNIIQQGRRSENSTIISYGAEGLRWKENRLDILFNTIVNDLPAGGYFVTVHPQGVETVVRHNVLVGGGQFNLKPGADLRSNVHARPSDFADAASFDLRPRVGTSWVGTASGIQHDFAASLLPDRQYKHTAATQPLVRSRLGALSPGAVQTLAP
jgi:hypothetical protein